MKLEQALLLMMMLITSLSKILSSQFIPNSWTNLGSATVQANTIYDGIVSFPDTTYINSNTGQKELALALPGNGQNYNPFKVQYKLLDNSKPIVIDAIDKDSNGIFTDDLHNK